MNLRLSLAQLYTEDDVTTAHRSYSEGRLRLDTQAWPQVPKLEGHVDARFRQGWTAQTENQLRVSRLYLQYGSDRDPWLVALGRLTIFSVGQGQLDGIHAGFKLSPTTHLGVFGGLVPHPITDRVDASFMGFGLGYRTRAKTQNHSGGVMVQLYQGELDRLYLSERFHFRPSKIWSTFGLITMDFLHRSGILGELSGDAISDQGFFDRIDITQGRVAVRYRPSDFINTTLSLQHTHTVLPNKWWDDWVEEERARLGFSLDGPFPQGSRRSSVRSTTNIHVNRSLWPYATFRYDRRHEDHENGLSAKGGLKLNIASGGYVDSSVTVRRHFEATQVLASMQSGVDVLSYLSLDGGITVMRVSPEIGSADTLYDLNFLASASLGGLHAALKAFRLTAMYQAFIDDEMVQHIFFMRLGYRFRSSA